MKVNTFVAAQVIMSVILALAFSTGWAQQCNGADKLCPEPQCCSIWGFCGSSEVYCEYSCHSQCWPSTTLADIINGSIFDDMFSSRRYCPSKGFYSYRAFLAAAESFPTFGNTGDVTSRKREIAAFLALVSHATSEKRYDIDDPFRWGLCHINTTAYESDFCTSSDWPCVSGKKYSPRGAIQLTHNFNYGRAGQAIDLDLINNPELVATNPIVSFKTAIWFWMTQHGNKPSLHNIVISAAKADRTTVSMYGLIGSIMSAVFGDERAAGSSVGFYVRFSEMLGVQASELKYGA